MRTARNVFSIAPASASARCACRSSKLKRRPVIRVFVKRRTEIPGVAPSRGGVFNADRDARVVRMEDEVLQVLKSRVGCVDRRISPTAQCTRPCVGQIIGYVEAAASVRHGLDSGGPALDFATEIGYRFRVMALFSRLVVACSETEMQMVRVRARVRIREFSGLIEYSKWAARAKISTPDWKLPRQFAQEFRRQFSRPTGLFTVVLCMISSKNLFPLLSHGGASCAGCRLRPAGRRVSLDQMAIG